MASKKTGTVASAEARIDAVMNWSKRERMQIASVKSAIMDMVTEDMLYDSDCDKDALAFYLQVCQGLGEIEDLYTYIIDLYSEPPESVEYTEAHYPRYLVPNV